MVDQAQAHTPGEDPEKSRNQNPLSENSLPFGKFAPWDGIDTTGLKTEIRHPVYDADKRLKSYITISIEPLKLDSVTSQDAQRVMQLEKSRWRQSVGIVMDETRIQERFLGNYQIQKRQPNPIIVLRVGGTIQAAIFMSFVTVDKDTDPKQLCTYRKLERAHDAAGKVIVDFSVVTSAEEKIKNLKLFDVIARASVALGQRLEKEHVIAYSRAEFLSMHLGLNPNLNATRYEVNPGEHSDRLVFAHFTNKHSSPTLGQIADFFGFNATSEQLHAAAALIQKRRLPVPPEKQLRDYLNLTSWRSSDIPLFSRHAHRALSHFAKEHIFVMGDPFLSATHQRLGAKYIAVVPNSRLADPGSLYANVLMCYQIPPLPSGIDRSGLSLQGHGLMPYVVEDGQSGALSVVPPLSLTAPHDDRAARARFGHLVRQVRRIIRAGVRDSNFEIDD